ncbi:MAG TPA: metallophosphoesterase [Candidatus Rifleibacterium sp.]|nr:metallophosphoesterase [Candidatus Rifleibacterium sp.]HPT45576.1 metallophosphoesterase [Candidatus Rifleibacterium sp.]
MYDFIGDIHGYADELRALLTLMGYQAVDGVFRHPGRQAFFTGDFIDRGPKIRETLQIVKSMIDNGQALAIMGNHEFNAICYNIADGRGDFLRRHTEKNNRQHAETLRQFESCRTEYHAWIQWFKTLPMAFEADEFRVVHACWDAGHISAIREALQSDIYCQNDTLSDRFFAIASDKYEPLYRVIEETLKGKELRLPEGRFFTDKDGQARREIRVRWWQNPLGQAWKDLGIHFDPALPEGLVDAELIKSPDYYRETERPVFFGHYWYKGEPALLRGNVCCLDYSVAKGGHLVAYRFNGEKQLSNNNFVAVARLSR